MQAYPVLDIYKTGQRIKEIMQQHNMSVQTLQKYLGLETPQSIYHWFNGRNMPSVDNLYALSELFGIPVDGMLCGNRTRQYHFEEYYVKRYLYVYYKKLMELKAV